MKKSLEIMRKTPFLFYFFAFILNFNSQKVDLPNDSFFFDLLKVSEYQYDIKLKLNELNFSTTQLKSSSFSKMYEGSRESVRII